MKKLLALVLCVMLFITIVPTAAFAAVDLSPAYQALEGLNNAYAQLAAATAVKNAYDGFTAYEAYFGDDSFAGATAGFVADLFKVSGQNLVTDVRNLGRGISYEELFERVAPAVYPAYDAVGLGVGVDVALEVLKVEQSINQAIQDLVNSIK